MKTFNKYLIAPVLAAFALGTVSVSADLLPGEKKKDKEEEQAEKEEKFFAFVSQAETEETEKEEKKAPKKK